MSEFTADEVRVLKALASGLLSASGGSQSSGGGGAVADDADLDGQYGDETIKRDPSQKYWTGESYKDATMSQCPPDYLDAYAKYREACAYMNDKAGDATKTKYAGYDRKSAARARGWAKRIRDGKVAAPATAPTPSGRSASRTNAAPPPPADTGGHDEFGESYGEESEIPFIVNMTDSRTMRA